MNYIKAYFGDVSPSSSCILNIPECTELDNVRSGIWSFIQRLDLLPCDVIEALKKAKNLGNPGELAKILRGISSAPACLIELLERYSADECSEIATAIRCLWEFIQSHDWNKSVPKRLRLILDSLNDKDSIVPSDCLIDRLNKFVREKLLSSCLIKILKEIRFCVQPKPPCPTCPTPTTP